MEEEQNECPQETLQTEEGRQEPLQASPEESRQEPLQAPPEESRQELPQTPPDESQAPDSPDSADPEPGKEPTLPVRREPAEPAPTAKHKRPKLPKNLPFVTIDSAAGVQTDADRERDDLLDLLESVRKRRILTDFLQGMERASDGGIPSGVVTHGAFKIIIPATEILDIPEGLGDIPIPRAMGYLLSRLMGAEIDYIVRGLDPESGIAVASRKDAMAVKRRFYYFTPDRDGNFRLYEDCLAEARVTAVYPSCIFAEIFGVDVKIPLHELSYQRIFDVTELFATGDRVLTKMLEIKRREDGRVQVRASVKQAQENPVHKAIQRYAVGNVYTGIVTFVDVIGIFVALDGGGECLCDFTQRGRPPLGYRVSVRIRDIDLENNRMWGVITYWA